MTDDPYGRYGVPGASSDPYGDQASGGYGSANSFASPNPYPEQQGNGTPSPYGDPNAFPAQQPQQVPQAQQGPGFSGYQGYAPYAPPPPTSGKAIASLVIGILAIVSSGCLSIAAPVGLVLGILGIKETNTGEKSGRGLAIAGVITSAVGTVLLLLVILYFVLIVGVGVFGHNM